MACSTIYTNSAQDYLDSVQEVCCAYDPCFSIFEITTTLANQYIQFGLINNLFASPVTVDWGDGSSSLISGVIGAVPFSQRSHNYATPGKYIVKFKTTGEQLVFNSNILTFSANSLTDIKQWGCTKFSGFNLLNGNTTIKKITAIDTPKGLTNLTSAFRNTTNLSYVNNINSWDTSNVTTLNATFRDAVKFNQTIDGWNTGSVTNMSETFLNAKIFNQPLNSWDVSKVTTTYVMFKDAESFNQPLNNWKFSVLNNMRDMFQNAFAFNQNINTWNVSTVTNMQGVFSRAFAYNQPMNNWNTQSATNMRFMFDSASSFNQDISNFKISNVIDITDFMNTYALNPPMTFSVANYDKLLISFASQVVQPNLNIGFDSQIKRSAASQAAYNILDLAPNNWTITDGGLV